MALALNIYKTKTGISSITVKEIYKAPVGYTGVVLCSNITNVGNTTRNVTLTHNRTVKNAAGISTTVTEMFKTFPIESSDSISAISGKLFLEPGDSIKINSNVDNEIKYIFSILETLN
jgi:hypothetical protein